MRVGEGRSVLCACTGTGQVPICDFRECIDETEAAVLGGRWALPRGQPRIEPSGRFVTSENGSWKPMVRDGNAGPRGTVVLWA
jgi:hypothetical protein